jgi:hypothetical protein
MDDWVKELSILDFGFWIEDGGVVGSYQRLTTKGGSFQSKIYYMASEVDSHVILSAAKNRFCFLP